MRFKFLKPLAILTVVLAVLLLYPLMTWLVDVRPAVYAAWAMAFGNAFLGLVIIELVIDKDNTIFMTAFFGGMGIRAFIVLIIFGVLISEGYHAMTLTFFLMGLYFAYMGVEILYLVKEIAKLKQRGGRYRSVPKSRY